MVTTRCRISALLYLSLLLSIPVWAQAQSVTITGPAAQTVREGDDFATNQLGNPWDFEDRRDIGWEENFTPDVTVASGIWNGTNSGQGGYVFPLFPGFKALHAADALPGDKTLPQLGITHRIDSSRYTLLSYRLNASSRSAYAIYWENNDSKSEYWPDGSNYGAAYDGFYHIGWGHPRSGWNIYSFDMSSSASFEQRAGSWSGSIFALRIDPSVSAPAGATTQFDWVRLVDPNSAPSVDVTWNSSGLTNYYVISVMVDNDASGYDGTPLAVYTSGSNPGRHTVRTAMLPPGDWHFYVSAQLTRDGQAVGGPVRSGYSSRLRIVKKPNGHFTSPTQVTGEDYASRRINNPWDMNGPGDVANLNLGSWPDEWRQFSNWGFVPSGDAQDASLFQAQADAPLPGNNESDVQLHMNVPLSTPIDTSRYRYLTYRIAADPANYPTISDKVRRGWVTRPVFWNSHIISDAGTGKAHVLYEGWHTYTIDLWDASMLDYGKLWRSFANIYNLRIDPLETDVPTWFWLDWVKLTADNRPSSGQFTLQFVISELAADRSAVVDFYYDTDKSGFDGAYIGSMQGLPAGAHSFTWNTSGLPENVSYYVYMVLRDGLNTTHIYAPVPIVTGEGVQPPEGRSGSVPLDFDGDGVSDQTVYRRSSGTYFNNLSLRGFYMLNWGNSSFWPVQADVDGDGIADRGLVLDWQGYLYWYFSRSSDGQLYWVQWGLRGDQPIIADYNGNGIDEVAVYRAGSWFIMDEWGHVSVRNWGLPGDIPVPRDYDGDGKADISIWRPSDGMWWILYSGFESGFADNYYAAIQWGLPGDMPVPADWTGDGRADPAVYRPGYPMWFLRDIRTSETSATQWGLPGDQPIVGDFNGDGRLDLSVFRPSTCEWFHNYRNGQWGMKQFGLPGDVVPAKTS